MAMTEKQGGSDVRANTTSAAPAGAGGPGGEYRLTGHKWFCSAPMSDAFLVLAQAPRGLSCFLLPRVLDDGSRNAFHIERLKDKLGNRSNASAAVELAEALECLGGNGYVEESIAPRLYREAPVNSIWEGSGNVNALDALRALQKAPATAEALFAEVGRAAGADRRLDAYAAGLRRELGRPEEAEHRARRLVEQMA